MPTTATLATFVAATAAMLIVPGPSVLYVVTRSVEHGRAAGLLSMLGLETGALCHAVGTAAGLAAVLASSEVALGMVRYCGAGYLLYLGVRQLRTSRLSADAATAGRATSRLRLYLDGMLVDLLNPKTALFFIAFLPMFVDPGRGSVATQLLVLGLCFVAMAVASDTTYAVVAGGFARQLHRSVRAQRYIGRTAGCVYVGMAALAAAA